MNIFVTNDDGFQADGLQTLVRILSEIDDVSVYVCAPEGQRSASGHSITTVGGPIMVKDVEVPGAVWAQAISGTPADCTKSGLRRLQNVHGVHIDAVFSGINHGSNIGTDVYYSGTVSAAFEGAMNGVPSIAMSVASSHPEHSRFEDCAPVIRHLVKQVIPQMNARSVLNVNFPDLPAKELRGVQVTRLGPREYNEKFDLLENPRGEKYYWYSGNVVHYENLPEDLDVMAHQNGYITVTPMKLDVTDYTQQEAAAAWMADLKMVTTE